MTGIIVLGFVGEVASQAVRDKPDTAVVPQLTVPDVRLEAAEQLAPITIKASVLGRLPRRPTQE